MGVGCNNSTVSVDEAMETCKDFPVTEEQNCYTQGRPQRNPDHPNMIEYVDQEYIAGCISPDPSIITKEECVDAVMHGENPYSTK